MIPVLAELLEGAWKPLAVGAGLLAVIGGIYLKGHLDGSDSEQEKAKTAVVNQLKQRNATDEKVEGMSPAELCRAIGGVWRDDGCK